MKNRSAFYFCAVFSLVLAGCFQPVDLGETFVEKATAYLRVTNDSADTDYILEGVELRSAAGEVVESWNGLDLRQGKTWEVHTETSGSFMLWFRVKDTWVSLEEVEAAYSGRQVKIELNKPYEFSFKGEGSGVMQQDSDSDGFPDVWEKENGFDPNNSVDGYEVYASSAGDDETGNGTATAPYKTLAKAVAKAGRGLITAPRSRAVVVLDQLGPASGNGPDNPAYPGRSDSAFYLGKTRGCVTIRGKESGDRGTLTAAGSEGKRVLYLGPGANIALQDISITGGRQSGGGVYASGAKLTLGSGAAIENNNQPESPLGSPTNPSELVYLAGIEGGGVYMERGALIMEPGSSINDNMAYMAGGVTLLASQFTMKGGGIRENYGRVNGGGLSADGCTIEMFSGAAISGNTVGIEGNGGKNDVGNNAGGVGLKLSTLTMYQDSKISGNWVYSGYGGGVLMTGESKLIMKGGEISGNHVTKRAAEDKDGFGGGLAATFRSSLVMESGSISGNEADIDGGGLYLMKGASFNMTAGSIAGNKAGAKGGGVYVGGDAGAVLVTGGTIYGKDDADNSNRNIAEEESKTNTGHAIYNARPGAIPAVHNNGISNFSIP
jgi:hypothetical protein